MACAIIYQPVQIIDHRLTYCQEGKVRMLSSMECLIRGHGHSPRVIECTRAVL